jgi:hypothetical protein
MAQCLTLGGVTAEMAIEDLNTALTTLITSLVAQGVTTQDILRSIEGTGSHTEEEMRLLNIRIEEAFDTKLDKEDIE